MLDLLLFDKFSHNGIIWFKTSDFPKNYNSFKAYDMLILKEKASVFETEDVATYVNGTIDTGW